MTAQPIVMKLPYPISTNVYWKHRVVFNPKVKQHMAMVYVSAEAKAFKEQVAWIAKQYGVTEPIKGRVAITVDLYPKLPQDWKRRQKLDPEFWDDTVQCQDLDNLTKALNDSLNGVVITDDSMIRGILLRRMVPDGEARMIVTITPIPRQLAAAPPAFEAADLFSSTQIGSARS